MMRRAGLGHQQLVDALLHAVREHDWNRQAAVRLLVEHGAWLNRRCFWDHVDIDSDFRGHAIAWVEFGELADTVDRWTASSSERAVLRLACHLAGDLPERPRDAEAWSLAEILRPLDHTRSALALTAIEYAATGRWR
jgi:hypothetical protein